MSTRIITFAVLTMAAMTGSAAASSFVTFGEPAPAATPSFVMIGAPAPVQASTTPSVEVPVASSPQAPDQIAPANLTGTHAVSAAELQVISPSVIALGEPLPPVTYEKVAAIPKKTRAMANLPPMVIRGGVVGNASTAASAPAPRQAAAEPAPAAASPMPVTAPAAPPAPDTAIGRAAGQEVQ